MGLYNFKARFAPMILAGEKTHTIRAVRKHPARPGETLHLYTGLRQKGARLLLRAPCTRVEEITIRQTRCGIASKLSDVEITIAGQVLDPSEMDLLAERDGFKNLADMMRFWQEPTNRLPFRGHIIHWQRP